MKKFSLLVFALVLLTACSPGQMFGPTPTPDPCSAALLPAQLDKLTGIAQRFDDATKLANNTSRVNLPPVISDLQAIRRDAQDLELPGCMAKVKARLITYMDSIIDAYIIFLDPDNPKQMYLDKFKQADQQLGDFNKAIDDLTAAALDITPAQN